MKKHYILGMIILLMLTASFSSFGDETDDYTVMIYLNGSDLESTYDNFAKAFAGNATKDLNEMIAGQTIDGTVNVVVQTGGTKKWANDFVDPAVTQRFELQNGQFVEIESLPPQNMGYKKTLSDFIVWGQREYPADKYALILWNHGAGPVGGYGVDELANFDSLGLEELRGALSTAKEKTGTTLELLGFDACLMASVEVADTVKDYSKYLVASEELEPGHGWDYQAILTALNANPEMDGATLGKLIATSYLSHAKVNGTESEVTLSVIDLAKVAPLVTALENLIAEADSRMLDNIFFYEFARSALAAKSFGGNTESQGFTDLIDAGDFANGLTLNQPEKSTAFINAVNEAVIYKVDGPFSFNTSGLSIYFPYRDKANYADNMAAYTRTGFSPVYQGFLKTFKQTVEMHMAKGPIEYTVNEPNEYTDFYELVLSQDGLEKIYYVYIDLYTYPMIPTEIEYDTQYLGYDFLVEYNDETQSYFDNFTFNWTYLDNEPLMTYVTNDYGDVVLYESPVLYNGIQMNLLFSWINEISPTGEDLGRYEIYGLRQTIDPETGMPDKNLYQVEAGSVINPLYLMEDFETERVDLIIGNPVAVTEATDLYFEELPTELFLFQFRLTDFAFNHYLTDFYYLEKQ